MSYKFLLAIPCYNCETQITRVLDQVVSQLMHIVDNIIVVDNASTDGTYPAALKYDHYPQIEIIRNSSNIGLGGSFKFCTQYGLNHQYDYMIFMHGDDQASTHDIIPMLQNLEIAPYDAIWGARFMPQSNLQGYSKSRELANRFLNIFFSLITFHRIYEIGSGLNIYNLKSLKEKKFHEWPNHIAFDIFLLMNFLKLNSIFFPICWKESDQKSTTSNIGAMIKILGALLKWYLSKLFCRREKK